MPLISGTALGRKKPLFAEFSVPFPEAGLSPPHTLRWWIDWIVREQVAAFQQRQECQQVVRVLTERQIAEGTEKGKIEMGASEAGLQQVEAERAVAAAWQAFEDGLYLVVIDGKRQELLDQEIIVQPDSRIAFVRLVLLAGG